MVEDIIARYRLEVQQALGALNQIAATSDKTAKTTEDAFSKMGNSISNQFKGLASAAAAAFTLDKLVDYSVEAVKLAGKVEGVRIAFNRIGDGKMLQGLRDATKGTVSDLNLMTAAVRASNFKIPLEQMGTLLEFARRRAKETGEDIDYLVESIVVGIGRKSPLILDNLGISAVELRKRFNGISIEAANVGDIAKIVGDIATEELGKMGDEALTTADKLAQISTRFENIKVRAGEAFIRIAEIFDLVDQRQTEAQGIGLELAASDISFIKDIANEEERRVKATEQQVIAAKALADAQKRQKPILEEIKKLEEKIAAGGELPVPIPFFDRIFSSREDMKARVDELRNELYSVTVDTTRYSATVKALADILNGMNTEEIPPYIDNLENIGKTVKGLSDELQKIPVFTQAWVDKFNELEKANVRLKAAQNLVENLKDDIEKPVETNFIKVMEDEMPAHLQYLFSLEKENDDAMRALREQRVKDGLAELDEMDRARQAAYEKELKRQEQIQFAITAASQVAQSLISAELEMDTRANEHAMQMLDQRLEQGLISQETYNKEVAKIKYQQAVDEKQAALFSAMVSTFAAIAEALPNIPQSILAGVLGGIQIAMISSEPLPTFGKGGWVEGKKHAQGGVQIEAEGGEYIINARSATRYAKLLEDINRDRLDLSGWAGLDRSLTLNNMGGNSWTDRNLLSAIDRHRESDTQLLRVIASKLGTHQKRRGYA